MLMIAVVLNVAVALGLPKEAWMTPCGAAAASVEEPQPQPSSGTAKRPNTTTQIKGAVSRKVVLRYAVCTLSFCRSGERALGLSVRGVEDVFAQRPPVGTAPTPAPGDHVDGPPARPATPREATALRRGSPHAQTRGHRDCVDATAPTRRTLARPLQRGARQRTPGMTGMPGTGLRGREIGSGIVPWKSEPQR